MEQTSTSVGDTTQKVSDSPEATKTQYDKDKHDNIAYDTYRKAVTERKSALEENSALKARLAAFEQEKQIAEGNKDEVIAGLRKQLGEAQTELKQTRGSYTWNVVGAQIKGELAARGVRNPGKALEYAKAVHREDLKTVEVDENFNVNKQDMQRFVDNFLQSNQDMGFVGKVGVSDMPPGKVEYNGNENTPVDKLKDEDLMNAWRSAES